ncbi:MDV1 (YJL112W) and CAF4 (YKR036C) [Zygosaccharomyces parabailii]|nr:MDV1 (YJL112W) and CAF4 (YKR036C) [Zygosaccharomyces parabailii]
MSNDEHLSQLGTALSTTAAALFGSQSLEDTILSYSSPYKRVLHQAMTNLGSDGAVVNVKGRRDTGAGSFQRLRSTNGKSFFKSRFADSKTSFKVLSYLSDDQLRDIPGEFDGTNLSLSKKLLTQDSEASKSKKKNSKTEPTLFQGFEASLPVINETLDNGGKSTDAESLKTIDNESHKDTPGGDSVGFNDQFTLPHGLNPDRITDSYSIQFLKGFTGEVADNLDLLEIQKKVAASEIRELDYKLEKLKFMRELVFKRIAKIEQNELFLESNLNVAKDRISFLQEYGLEKEEDENDEEEQDFVEPESSEEVKAGEQSEMAPKILYSEPDDESDLNSPMLSKSVYQKLKVTEEKPSKKLHEFYSDKHKKHRKTYPTLQQYYSRGSQISSFKNAHDESIICLDFDVPFGTLATAGHMDHSIKLWDLSKKKKVGQMTGHHASISCMQLDNQYNMVITGGRDAVLKLWNLTLAYQLYQEDSDLASNSESACVYTFDSHVDEITALSFDSGHLVSGSQDRTFRQWDLSTGKCVQTIDVSFACRGASGKSLASSSLLSPVAETPVIGALQCFDAALATGTKDGVVRLWDLRSGKIIRSLEGHTDAITTLKFDSRNLITGSLDRSVRIWDLRTGALADAFAFESSVLNLDFDLQNIVTAVGENGIKVFDRDSDKHWVCGKQEEDEAPTSQFVKYKNGYMVEGRSNGDVNTWAI